MECQASDSKKLFKVFEASKRKRVRKKRDSNNDNNSVATDDSNSGCLGNGEHASPKASLQDVSIARMDDASPDPKPRHRDRSLSNNRSPVERTPRSPRRHRRFQRDGNSLALKAGLVSTPRSDSIPQDVEDAIESISKDQDSSIYAYLEDAIKRDKKKHRHGSRRHERTSREREPSGDNGEHHRHRHRRRVDEMPSVEREKHVEKPKDPPAITPAIDQSVILETFAKLCATLNEKTAQINQLTRNQSHKSLQCEEITRQTNYDVDRHPIRLRSTENSRENIPLSRTRTRANVIHDGRVRSQEDMLANLHIDTRKVDKCGCFHPPEHDTPKYESKVNVRPIRPHEGEPRYREYPPDQTKSIYHGSYRSGHMDAREYKNYDSHKETIPNRSYEEEKRRYLEPKTSRSYEGDRGYEEKQRTSRTDYKRYHREGERDRRSKDKYYEDKIDARERHFISTSKERRSRRNLDHYERNSTVSRDEDYRERDRYSERERDSGLSVADGDTSTVSGKSNYLRVVKQEIAEQREAMDKMMKLWKELMRCFKGLNQAQKPDKVAYEKAETAHDSAAAQLRLWRECMRRYETVARDVGDTDARLMEEINKQRSEMAEMSTMWQECLQRYRDMSNDFNNLKQQLATSESPTRDVGLSAPLVEAPPPHYPAGYPLHAPHPPMGTTLRQRASAPPAWWWTSERPAPRTPPPQPRSPRRRSSPDSRASPERRRRHYHRDRDDSRTKYKEKSKASAARSEHRHKKR